MRRLFTTSNVRRSLLPNHLNERLLTPIVTQKGTGRFLSTMVARPLSSSLNERPFLQIGTQ
jgi:hypothetical protein